MQQHGAHDMADRHPVSAGNGVQQHRRISGSAAHAFKGLLSDWLPFEACVYAQSRSGDLTKPMWCCLPSGSTS